MTELQVLILQVKDKSTNPQILQFDKLSLNIVGKFYSVFTDLLLIYSVISKSRFLPWKKNPHHLKSFMVDLHSCSHQQLWADEQWVVSCRG